MQIGEQVLKEKQLQGEAQIVRAQKRLRGNVIGTDTQTQSYGVLGDRFNQEDYGVAERISSPSDNIKSEVVSVWGSPLSSARDNSASTLGESEEHGELPQV